MDPELRRVISEGLDTLVKGTDDIDGVVKALKRKDVLNDIMVEKIMNSGSENKECLYKMIVKRGPDAFTALYDSFMEVKNYPLADFLRPHIVKDIVVQNCAVRMDTDHEKMYKMSSNPRGYVLLINIKNFKYNIHEERLGSEKDEAKLIELWQSFGYKIIKHRDLSTEEFQNAIIEFRDMEEHKDVDSAIIFIMSHGTKDAQNYKEVWVQSSYGPNIKSEWIIQQFTADNCEHLKSKPKLFFFQTCRGSDPNYGIQIDGGMANVPSMADIFIAFATIPGKASLRHRTLGAHFVQKICSVFQEHAHDTDLDKLLQQVNRELKDEYYDSFGLQIIEVQSRQFDRKLYFNPGFYE